MDELTREDKVKAKLWLDQLADAATAESKRLSVELADEAYEEYRRTKSLPTWRFEDLAVVAAGASHAAVVVADEATFTKWARVRYPDQVETIYRVRPAWLAGYLKRLQHEGLSAVDKDEVVPGLVVKPGGQFIGVTVTGKPEAKEVYAAVAQASLRRFALDAGPLAVPTLALSGGDDA